MSTAVEMESKVVAMINALNNFSKAKEMKASQEAVDRYNKLLIYAKQVATNLGADPSTDFWPSPVQISQAGGMTGHSANYIDLQLNLVELREFFSPLARVEIDAKRSNYGPY